MLVRRAVVPLLVVALFSLAPLAQATPPDQTWIAGWYDNADYDNVVLLTTSTAALTDAQLVWQVPPMLPVVAVVVSHPRPAPPSPPLSRSDSRAPPSV